MYLKCGAVQKNTVNKIEENEREKLKDKLLITDYAKVKKIKEKKRRCLHLSDTFAHRSAHNNLFLELHVIHKLKTKFFIYISACEIFSVVERF